MITRSVWDVLNWRMGGTRGEPGVSRAGTQRPGLDELGQRGERRDGQEGRKSQSAGQEERLGEPQQGHGAGTQVICMGCDGICLRAE